MMKQNKITIPHTTSFKNKTLLIGLSALLSISISSYAAETSPINLDIQPSSSMVSDTTEVSQTNMGGPYVIGGNANENSLSANAGKVAEFGAYYAKALFYSQITPLTPELLKKSMETNLEYDGNGEPLPQMYNYVIEDNVLYVAIWQPRQAALESNTDCNLDFDRLSNNMPDAYEADNKDCPINVYSGKDVGIEDAVSKHFLISQLGGEAGKLESYVPKEWIQTTVDYAGEIHVYPTYNHNKGRYRYQYTINSNSGTYRPDNGDNNLCSEPQVNLDYLNGAADVFQRILKKSPTSLDVINYGDAGEVTTSIAYPLTQSCYSIN